MEVTVNRQIVTGTNCFNCVFANSKLERIADDDKLDPQGGLLATTDQELDNAKENDLVTLPGKQAPKGKRWCDNESIDQYVTNRQCCALWNGKGTYRQFEQDNK